MEQMESNFLTETFCANMYIQFLRTVPTNTEVFLHALGL